MGTGFRILCVMSLSIAFFCAGVLPAQTPPPDSTSKVKRILLYNKIAAFGFHCIDCRDKVQEVFFHMAQSKGFSVDTTSSVSFLTPENLKRYQVIVWNNNTDGQGAVPDSQARNAVSEYVRLGGGWMLVNIANEHGRSWPFLTSLIGPGTSGWQGRNVSAALVSDSTAKMHPELRHIVNALPESFSLQTNWLNMFHPLDETPNLKVLYRVENAVWITEDPGRYKDHYIWAATHEQGKALSIPLGWEGGFRIDGVMTQADSAVPRLYWQGLRWLAGDFQNGCIDPNMPKYDPEARVDDGSCPTLAIRSDRRQARTQVRIAGRRMMFSTPVSGGSRLKLLDLRGHIVWKSTALRIASGIALPEGLQPGLYFLETVGRGVSFQARILVP